jgi:hypothetical protein
VGKYLSHATRAVVQSNFNKGIPPKGSNSGNGARWLVYLLPELVDDNAAKQETSRKANLQRRVLAPRAGPGNEAKG